MLFLQDVLLRPCTYMHPRKYSHQICLTTITEHKGTAPEKICELAPGF